MIKISKRLKKISEYVDDNSYVIDVGCDHGLLSIYLVENKKNIKVIATDINQNALNNAIKNIKKNNLENKIKTVLTDGLDNIDTNKINTIIISGMGSHTIVGILYKNMKKLKNVDTLILQSNNDLDFLRYKITKINYKIENETLIKDQGIIYTIIKFTKGHRFYNIKELYFGPYLLKEKSDLFYEKVNRDLEKLLSFYPLIPKNHFNHKIKTLIKIKMHKKILNKKSL